MGRLILAKHPWSAAEVRGLEPGHYLISAFDQDGLSLVFPDVQIGAAPLAWPADFEMGGSEMDP